MTSIGTYLAVYMAVGVVILITETRSNSNVWLRQRRDPGSIAELIQAMDPQSKTLWHRIRARVLLPILASAAMVILWPGVLVMWFRWWREDREMTRHKREQIFRVTREALLEPLTVDEIEARELVSDPLNAAPQLPFGHLNGVWSQLKSELKPGDQLWSFSKHWQDNRGRPDQRTGYAIWRGSKSVFHIYTMWKSMDGSLTNAPSGRASLNLDLSDIEVPAFLRRQAD